MPTEEPKKAKLKEVKKAGTDEDDTMKEWIHLRRFRARDFSFQVAKLPILCKFSFRYFSFYKIDNIMISEESAYYKMIDTENTFAEDEWDDQDRDIITMKCPKCGAIMVVESSYSLDYTYPPTVDEWASGTCSKCGYQYSYEDRGKQI